MDKQLTTQSPQALQTLSTYRLIEKTDSREVSIYSGELTIEAVTENITRIRVVWPELFNRNTPEETKLLSDIFIERLKANNFTDEKFRDAVNYVLDNYKAWNHKPQIADFISYDRTIPLFTQIELLDKYRLEIGIGNNPINRYYTLVNINDLPFYVRKEDAVRYSLKPFEVKKKPNSDGEGNREGEFLSSQAVLELVGELISTLCKPAYNPQKRAPEVIEDRRRQFIKILQNEGALSSLENADSGILNKNEQLKNSATNKQQTIKMGA